ncbi:protein of unknown function [Acidithiobacillus ferrivorans]|uniref:Uncharacterized protein n=1 Tax=Acidithiobacillus ferrivorans TaxID=160808 RepID=A0ABY1MRF2_9PROT|nr:protein of unknown function [Acidithiobacillus ferrivorans]
MTFTHVCKDYLQQTRLPRSGWDAPGFVSDGATVFPGRYPYGKVHLLMGICKKYGGDRQAGGAVGLGGDV